jgi:hypothetical protein
MKPAKKLKINHFAQQLLPYAEYIKDNTQPHTVYGKTVNGEFKGVSYYSLPIEISYEVLQFVIPEMYRDKFVVSLMVITNDYIPPHIDNQSKVAINMYLKTSGKSVTTFYHNKEDIVKTVIEGQTDGYLIESNLDKKFYFTAKEDEAWILDIKKPHSVKCEKNEPRMAIGVSSNLLDYAETLKILCI